MEMESEPQSQWYGELTSLSKCCRCKLHTSNIHVTISANPWAEVIPWSANHVSKRLQHRIYVDRRTSFCQHLLPANHRTMISPIQSPDRGSTPLLLVDGITNLADLHYTTTPTSDPIQADPIDPIAPLQTPASRCVFCLHRSIASRSGLYTTFLRAYVHARRGGEQRRMYTVG